MAKNPVRQTLSNLCDEFEAMNINCLHFNVEVNALITERTHAENGKPLRRFCRCLGLVDRLQPEIQDYYKDRSYQILKMINQVRDHYDDLKRRYFWALDRLAEMTIRLNQMTEDQMYREAKETDLGESWEDFCQQQRHTNRLSYEQHGERRESSERTGIEDMDKLLGMASIGHRDSSQKKRSSQSDKKKIEESGRVRTKVKLLPMLTMIEDRPFTHRKGPGNYAMKDTAITKLLKKAQKSVKNEKIHKRKVNQELAYLSEIKMHIYSLTAEVAEKDKLIDSLNAQMAIKDNQIAQLSEVIRREKLGIEPWQTPGRRRT